MTLLDIGNTFTRIVSGENSRVVPTAGLSAADIPGGKAAACCVVPAVKERLKECDIFWLTSANAGNFVDFTCVDTSTLGADRVANAVALAAEYPLPAVCVDCGTAVTLEVVDKNRVFRGGAIAPGRKLMRNALSAGTAQLPEVPLFSEFPVTVGVDTQSSIAFGIDRGIIGLVRELIDGAAAQYGNDGKITVVFTGGDAAWFSAHFPGSFTAPADFTLRGLLKVTEK
jgi:type III pantothenate kinase